MVFFYKKPRQDYVSPEDFGGVASDDNADATANQVAIQAAFDTGEPLVRLNGIYRVDGTVTPYKDQTVSGANKFRDAIKMIDSVTAIPVIGIDDQGINLRDFQCGWVSTGQTDAGSVGIRFMDNLTGANGWGGFRDMRIQNTYTGIDVDQAAPNFAGLFSWEFKNLYIRQFEESGIFLNNVGSGNSGCAFENIYTANARSGLQETGHHIDIREAANMTMRQINVEANRASGEALMYMQNIQGFNLEALHYESLEFPSAAGSDNCLLAFQDRCMGVINGVSVGSIDFPATGVKLAIFRARAASTDESDQPRLQINSVQVKDTADILPSSQFNMWRLNNNVDAASGASIRVNDVRTELAFNKDQDQGTGVVVTVT